MRAGRLLRFGAPLFFVVLVLAVALAQVGANDSDNTNGIDEPGIEDERQVDQIAIDLIDVRIAESYPVQVFVYVQGHLPDPCWEPQEPVIVQDGSRFEVEIVTERDASAICAQVVEAYEHNLALGSPDPGDYLISVNGVEQEFEVY